MKMYEVFLILLYVAIRNIYGKSFKNIETYTVDKTSDDIASLKTLSHKITKRHIVTDRNNAPRNIETERQQISKSINDNLYQDIFDIYKDPTGNGEDEGLAYFNENSNEGAESIPIKRNINIRKVNDKKQKTKQLDDKRHKTKEGDKDKSVSNIMSERKEDNTDTPIKQLEVIPLPKMAVQENHRTTRINTSSDDNKYPAFPVPHMIPLPLFYNSGESEGSATTPLSSHTKNIKEHGEIDGESGFGKADQQQHQNTYTFIPGISGSGFGNKGMMISGDAGKNIQRPVVGKNDHTETDTDYPFVVSAKSINSIKNNKLSLDADRDEEELVDDYDENDDDDNNDNNVDNTEYNRTITSLIKGLKEKNAPISLSQNAGGTLSEADIPLKSKSSEIGKTDTYRNVNTAANSKEVVPGGENSQESEDIIDANFELPDFNFSDSGSGSGSPAVTNNNAEDGDSGKTAVTSDVHDEDSGKAAVTSDVHDEGPANSDVTNNNAQPQGATNDVNNGKEKERWIVRNVKVDKDLNAILKEDNPIEYTLPNQPSYFTAGSYSYPSYNGRLPQSQYYVSSPVRSDFLRTKQHMPYQHVVNTPHVDVEKFEQRQAIATKPSIASIPAIASAPSIASMPAITTGPSIASPPEPIIDVSNFLSHGAGSVLLQRLAKRDPNALAQSYRNAEYMLSHPPPSACIVSCPASCSPTCDPTCCRRGIPVLQHKTFNPMNQYQQNPSQYSRQYQRLSQYSRQFQRPTEYQSPQYFFKEHPQSRIINMYFTNKHGHDQIRHRETGREPEAFEAYNIEQDYFTVDDR